jgi:hypothetical protein
MTNEGKIVEFFGNTFESTNNRNMYFCGTPKEYDKFVNGINQIHKEEKLEMQNKYFRENWRNSNDNRL